MHLKFLNEYLNTATPTTLQFTKPHHQPHFSFISQKDHKTPNKSDSDTSWINPTPELVFLYDSLSSTSPAVRIQTIELISKIPIPFDLEPNNHDFNIFSIWNVISINNLDTEIFNIEENKVKLNTITNNEYLTKGNNLNKIEILFKKIEKNND